MLREMEKIFECDGCGWDIVEGDEYFKVDIHNCVYHFCADCMKDMKREASLEDIRRNRDEF